MLDMLTIALVIAGIIFICLVLPNLHFYGNVYRYDQTFNYWAMGRQTAPKIFCWTPVKPTLIPGIYVTDFKKKIIRLDPYGFIPVANKRANR